MEAVPPIEDEISDGEFDINPNPDEENQNAFQRLKEFSYYLVENIELNLDFFLKLLEERDVPAKPSSIQVTVLSKIASAIPKIGTGVGGALTKTEETIFAKINKRNSRLLANLIYYYSENKETFRKLLIESAIDIFCSFEDQFKKLTCNGGEKRAMQKLAKDASDRIFYYFLETEQGRDVTKNEITKGILYGESKRNSTGRREGKTVRRGEMKWKTCKLFQKVGVVIVEEKQFYKNTNTHTEKYGYRRPLPWEIKEEIENSWKRDALQEIPNYTLKSTEELLKQLRDYIMTKSPVEQAKLERETYSSEAKKDREEKYDKLSEIISNHFQVTLEELEKQFCTTNNIHNENKVLLEKVLDKQNEDSNSSTEIKIHLQEIHEGVIETKEGQVIIVKEIGVIKSSQEEMASTIVKVDDIKEIVHVQSKESMKSGIKELVHETLSKNDPGPAIKKEFERSLEKLKKNDPGPAIGREIRRGLKKLKF